MLDKIKIIPSRFINISKAPNLNVNIIESFSHETSILRNKFFYNGDAWELEQFFKQLNNNDKLNRARFWSAAPSNGLSIRKIHSGLPKLIVNKITEIVCQDIDELGLEDEKLNTLWEDIAKDNKFDKVLHNAIKNILITGDGAFKISLDTEMSDYPIIEFFNAENVKYEYKRGRLQEVNFITNYLVNNKKYKFIEHYGRGYVKNELKNDNGDVVPLSTIPDLAELQDVSYNDDFIMAIPIMFYESSRFEGRGESILERFETFDALDEIISTWIQAIRDGKVMNYIPENLIPRNPNTGELTKPNSFDNKFIATTSDLSENAKNQITTVQAQINYEAYIESYANAIDMCLQGILSPSTLGIDLKKTDNATAQREKEKTTLYTRKILIDKLTETIPFVIETVLKVNDVLHRKNAGEYEGTIKFGEYASPDFDTVVETVGKAKQMGIMSIEKAVEELYGNTLSDEEKEEEIKRIKEQNNISLEEPNFTDTLNQNNEVLDKNQNIESNQLNNNET